MVTRQIIVRISFPQIFKVVIVWRVDFVGFTNFLGINAFLKLICAFTVLVLKSVLAFSRFPVTRSIQRLDGY